MGKRHIFILLVILTGTLAEETKLEEPKPEVAVAEDKDGLAADPEPIEAEESSGVPLSQSPEKNEDWDMELLQLPQAAPGAGVTNFEVERLEYNWTIINYSHNNLEYGKSLNSPIFYGKNSKDYRWQLQLYPRGNDDTAKTSVAVYLALLGKKGVTATVKVSIIDKNRNKVNPLSFKHKYNSEQGNGWKNFITQYNLETYYKPTYLPEDRLTFAIEIIFRPRTTHISGQCEDPNAPECAKLPFDSDLHNDVHLFVKDESIPAHKAALAFHSTWFAEQIKNNPWYMSFSLPDGVDADDLKEALKFIYTGKIDPDKAEKLGALADKLGMKKLKEHTEHLLCNAMAPTKPEEKPAA